MKISCGIIGLPNVGKSSLFNILTNQNVRSENYPFCTIDPNVGISEVYDKRQEIIKNIFQSKKVIRAQVKFIDIAGLIKGASLGEGLGNKFLSNIRDTDAIMHVVRCFENHEITYHDEQYDPIKNIDIINTELLLSDISLIENALSKKKKKFIYNSSQKKFLENLYEHVNNGFNIRSFKDVEKNMDMLNSLNFLTLKPVIYIANVGEKYDNITLEKIKEKISKDNSSIIVISIKGKKDENIINSIINKTYKILNLITFFSAGKKEIKAWSIKKNSIALDAANKIHSDIKKGFIRAEVTSYDDFISKKINLVKPRLEGKKYIVKDGDIINFRFNV